MRYVDLIKEAAQYLNKTKKTFTRKDIENYIREKYPDFPLNPDSLNPIIQGMTVNAVGGVPVGIGNNILKRVERGKYQLYIKTLDSKKPEKIDSAPDKSISNPSVIDRWAVGIFITILVIFLVCFLVSIFSTLSGDTQYESLEYMLAVIDHSYLDEDDPIIVLYAIQLNSLDEKFLESRYEIANMTVKTQNLLRSTNIDISLYDILTGINSIIPRSNLTESTKISYAEYSVAYERIRRDLGYDHLTALLSVEEYLKGIKPHLNNK